MTIASIRLAKYDGYSSVGYSYFVPSSMTLEEGDIVVVHSYKTPTKLALGLVTGVHTYTDPETVAELKTKVTAVVVTPITLQEGDIETLYDELHIVE